MIENQYLLDYIGKTKTVKLVNEINKNYFEQVFKKYPKSDQTSISNIKGSSLVTIMEEKEIKSIGMSCVDDLLTDNFGLFWQGIIGRNTPKILVDHLGVNRSVNIYAVNNSFTDTDGDPSASNYALGSYIQIGDGVTTPTRQDFELTNVIGGFNVTGLGGWNSGLGQVSVSSLSAVLIGSGTITETGLFNRWFTPNTAVQFLMSHDLISPIVPYVNGNVASIEYTLQL